MPLLPNMGTGAWIVPFSTKALDSSRFDWSSPNKTYYSGGAAQSTNSWYFTNSICFGQLNAIFQVAWR